jgi:uncharacterized radical SAM superfamily Fe-S cluster-containing enzyme
MQRPYTYFDYTQSLCSKCLELVSTKIIFEDSKVYMLKNCLKHGMEKTLIESDYKYYKKIRNFIKQSEMPKKFGTPVKHGCPYDCGLCTDHEQHSCLSVIEITDRCNLTCPTCYSGSSPSYGRHRTLEEVEKMLNVLVEHEGEPDVVQISGGEPTLHPHFFEILDKAKSLPIRHLMLNTNGIKIANDEEFVKRLSSYMPKFEVYLQFDSFEKETLEKIRGSDLREIRKRALLNLNKYNISTTLVVVLQKNLNDNEIGDIINYALTQKCVRGVTFQPTQDAGRNLNFDSNENRITISEIIKNILTQTTLFNENDIIPVPCNPDALAMGYALKLQNQVVPLTRYINPEELLSNEYKNTIIYEQNEDLKNVMIKTFSTGESAESVSNKLNTLLCCLPSIEAPNLTYENIFRIIIMKFMDVHDFDVRAVKKSCVHIMNKDYKLIPFETMNIFYRDEKIKTLNELIEK